MSVESVTMYKCPETGKLYKTKRGAENSAKQIRDKRNRELLATGFDPSQLVFQQDYVRLNATSPKHIIELVTEKAEEFWGLKVTRFNYSGTYINYSDSENCHVISFSSCEIEVDSSSSSRLEYMRRQAKRWWSEPSISDLLFDRMGFNGFKTGSGCPGRCSDQSHSGYPFRMHLVAKLEEFPIVRKRYEEWQANKTEYNRYLSSRNNVRNNGMLLARSTSEYEKLKELRDYYEQCEKILSKSMLNLEDYYINGLVEKWEKINPEVKKDTELWEMFD